MSLKTLPHCAPGGCERFVNHTIEISFREPLHPLAMQLGHSTSSNSSNGHNNRSKSRTGTHSSSWVHAAVVALAQICVRVCRLYSHVWRFSWSRSKFSDKRVSMCPLLSVCVITYDRMRSLNIKGPWNRLGRRVQRNQLPHHNSA